MAESVVRSVIQNLVPLLSNEADLLRNVHEEVASIKAELESIKAFLKDADSRAESMEDERAKTWVKQVRALAYQIEDVIDEYIIHLTEQRQRRGFINFLRQLAYSIIKLKPRHKLASQIQHIKRSLQEMKERADRYGFNSSTQGSSSSMKDRTWHDPRINSHFLEEDEVIGIEAHKEELMSKLIEGNELKQVVVSIVGMAGVGKTTLATQLYNNKTVTAHFNCRAWIPVSESYKIEELLRNTIKQLHLSREEPAPQGIDEMDQISLIRKLKEYLREKKYIVVFDDVWTTDFWESIKKSLPKEGAGSRVIITTRSKEVANFCTKSSLDHVHELEPLPEEIAWRLFCKNAFQRDPGCPCPPELEKTSRKIVRRCEGLPLAIVVIGGLLSTKNRAVHEWENFYETLGSQLERNPNLSSIKKIVLLSYQDLPYYLKSCFLYFSIIPEDYSISRERLIRLWIAEGFIEEQKGQILEQVAEEYLSELIYRNLVQVSERKYGRSERVKTCRIHDVVREIILSKSEELSFCQVVAKENSSSNDQTRRLSMHTHCCNMENLRKSQIRSVFLFSEGELQEKPSFAALAANLKLLKLVDLQDAPLDELHAEVGNLIHLRYLSARSTKVKVIPKSIGKLRNLQTLDLKYSFVSELPVEINMLTKLRHLLVYQINFENDGVDFFCGVKAHRGIGRLTELQKLCAVEASDDGIIQELENLRQLKKIRITKLKRENGRALCSAIEKMTHLQFMQAQAISEDEVLDVQSVSSPPESLQVLILAGRLEYFPNWISKLVNLTLLNLRWSDLADDPLKATQALPNLLDLRLVDGAYKGEQLYFEVGGFQKLKILSLRNLKKLNSVVIKEGALPLLERLDIGPSPQLKEVPSGIHHLIRLADLTLFDMPGEFLHRMQPSKGPDYWIVQHIPFVQLFFKSRGAYYNFCALKEFPYEFLNKFIQYNFCPNSPEIQFNSRYIPLNPKFIFICCIASLIGKKYLVLQINFQVA